MAPVALPRLLPRRDDEARARLERAARRARPVATADERVLPVDEPLGTLLPGRALRRGSVVTVEGAGGAPGAGATTVALRLAAAATAAGEWVGAVELDATLSGLAAAEAGVVLERFAVVRHTPVERWATVVAALLDGVGLVLAEVPAALPAADARRLVARARERGAVLVPVCRGAAWPAETALRVRAEGGPWSGLERGAGLLAARRLRVQVEGRGAATRPRAAVLARAG